MHHNSQRDNLCGFKVQFLYEVELFLYIEQIMLYSFYFKHKIYYGDSMHKTIILSMLFILLISLLSQKSPEQKVSLFGVNIIIDPGHGGKDNGACYQEVLEDELNLKIATKLMDCCIDNGAISSLTRVDDYDLASNYASNRKREDLKARVDFINNSGAQMFVSIHMNSYPNNSNVHGTMVYYDKNKEESKTLADEINYSLNCLTHGNKVIHYDDFYLFRNTDIPGVLVECGFISNSTDRNNLLDENYQNKMAMAIYQGLDNYLLGIRV